jgi:hypothetical protein
MVGTMYEGGPLRMVGHATERINFLTDTIKLALAKSQTNAPTYIPSNETETSYTTIASAMETTNGAGAGYTAGGSTVATPTLAMITDPDDSLRYLKFGGTAPAPWTSSTFVTEGGVVYDNTATNKPLICYLDFGVEKDVTAGTLTIVFDAKGICRLKVL